LDDEVDDGMVGVLAAGLALPETNLDHKLADHQEAQPLGARKGKTPAQNPELGLNYGCAARDLNPEPPD